jgi:hypothetical protein
LLKIELLQVDCCLAIIIGISLLLVTGMFVLVVVVVVDVVVSLVCVYVTVSLLYQQESK